MCGIAGIYNFSPDKTVSEKQLKRMVGALYHRGPDECGFLDAGNLAMGMARLSIIDLNTGSQPIHNEDKSVWTVFNGEIFNYIELKQELVECGHRFYTTSDTEVIVHAYEEYGIDFVSHLNGQFAIAIWDVRERALILLRDRFGIRPLYYMIQNNRLLFASEMKAIFAGSDITPQIDGAGLAQIFTFWVNIPPASAFKEIHELPPGHFLKIGNGKPDIRPYWSMAFPSNGIFSGQTKEEVAAGLREALQQAVTLRLRADVPVAAYLSGGIDSSIISALVKKYHNNKLITFSVAFSDRDYDERTYQEEMVKHIDTDHHMVEVGPADITRDFVNAVWYAEKPMMRTAPAPLYALSRLVRQSNIKVVLTGEGADEVFGGYNIFKEDKVRRFWARQPQSAIRPLLLGRLYPYILKSQSTINPFWQAFFRKNLDAVDNPVYSHLLRWENTSKVQLMFDQNIRRHFDMDRQLTQINAFVGKELNRWHPLNRAQYLEALLFMNGYLLSSQGDRMMMANSVEGRFPFLDHNLFAFSASIDPELKIRGLNEKYILKQAFSDLIPENIVKRPKQPYRAPIASAFLSESAPEIIGEMLSEKCIRNYGYFNPKAVARLVNKLNRVNTASARDDMSLVAVISTQLLHYQYVEQFPFIEVKLPEKQTYIKTNSR